MLSNTKPETFVDYVESKVTNEKPKPSSVGSWCSAQWRPILAELVSTTMLVLFGCMSCMPIDGSTQHLHLYAPIGFGLTVMLLIQIFGHISEAHMNPAVTLASVIWGNTSITLGVCYVIVQILGATIGYGFLVGLAPIDVSVNGVCLTVPHPGLSAFQTLVIEIVLTGGLVFICCAVRDPVYEHRQDSVPIKFGLAVIGLSVVGGPLTGASMNPARSLGPAIWTGVWHMHWTYWVGPCVGAALTTIFYKHIFLKKEKSVAIRLP